ncbi:MAG TPA: hypothetical protein VL326_03590 [Kofleriaceae bacterium]|jgi:hypothetical protein|nr:hypothetical protein [Kofleriaceae bacterium]
MKLRVLITFAFVALFAATPALAGKKFGKQVRFAGIHPVPKGEGGGICHIQGPHVHIYAANKLEYRMHDDDYVFVGDPMAYGWDGPKYAYKGNHPIQVNAVVGGDPDVEYCYINGPHFHYFEPEQPDFKLVGGAYFYVGEPPKAYIEARPQYVGINTYYEPVVYTRPVVEVAPPQGWIGARVDIVGPAVVVEAPPPVVVVPPRPVVEVHVPQPSIEVGIGVHVGGGFVVGGGGPARHGKFKQKKWKKRH